MMEKSHADISASLLLCRQPEVRTLPAVESGTAMVRRRDPGIGALIRELRRARGWTQKQLARKAAVTERTISNLERNTSPKPHSTSIAKVATALGIPPERLDSRQLGDAVAENATTTAKREAIRRLLALPESELQKIMEIFDRLQRDRTGRKR